MRLRKNGESSGGAKGTISDRRSEAGFSDEERSEGSEGPENGGIGGAELSADSGDDFRDSDSGDSGIETPRKRGRPKGSKNANVSKSGLSGRISDAKRKLGESFTGLVGFSFSSYGAIRASKIKKISPALAQRVYNCWQIKKETAAAIGKPMAEVFVEWFPVSVVEGAAKSVDPMTLAGNLIFVLKDCSDNEKLVIEQYQAQMIAAQQGQESNPDRGTIYNPAEEVINAGSVPTE